MIIAMQNSSVTAKRAHNAAKMITAFMRFAGDGNGRDGDDVNSVEHIITLKFSQCHMIILRAYNNRHVQHYKKNWIAAELKEHRF